MPKFIFPFLLRLLLILSQCLPSFPLSCSTFLCLCFFSFNYFFFVILLCNVRITMYDDCHVLNFRMCVIWTEKTDYGSIQIKCDRVQWIIPCWNLKLTTLWSRTKGKRITKQRNEIFVTFQSKKFFINFMFIFFAIRFSVAFTDIHKKGKLLTIFEKKVI